MEKEKIRCQVQENQSGLEQKENEHRQKVEELIGLKTQQESLRKETISYTKLLQAETDNHISKKEDYFHKASLLGSLEKLRDQFEGFHDGVKSLMNNQNDKRIPGLREVLVDVIQTPVEYEMAIETALGEKLQSVIVNTHSDSMEAIGYLNNHHSGRGLFAPINPKSIPGFWSLYGLSNSIMEAEENINKCHFGIQP